MISLNSCHTLATVQSRVNQIFYAYILAGQSGVLYTGVTNNLPRRIYEHKQKQIPGFTRRYNLTRLVWFECHSGPKSAIAREKQIKTWSRRKKVELINDTNPSWVDLSVHARPK